MPKLLRMWMCLVSGIALAQSGFTVCEVDAIISGPLEKATALASDPTLPFDARMTGFRDLMDRYPTDLFVNRLYLSHFGGYALLPLYDRQIRRYDALYRENATDPARRYLYAIARQRRDPKGSTAILEELVRELPDAPWPHLAVAWLYSHSKPTDNAKAEAELERFMALCPDTLDQLALRTLVADGNDDLKKKIANRLRRQLPTRTGPLALDAWPVLWKLEFQITPASGHDALRSRIKGDIVRLRTSKAGTQDRRLDVIRQAYTLLSDAEGRKAVQAELMRVAPLSRAAAAATLQQWEEQNPHPNRSAALAEQTAYRCKGWQAAKSWVERWPDYGPAYGYLYGALFLEDLPKEELAPLGRQVWGFMHGNPDDTLGFTDMPINAVAERLATAGVALDDIPAMLDRAQTNAQARYQSDLATTSRPFGEQEIAINNQLRNWSIRRAHVILHVRTGKVEAARTELEALQKEVNAAPANTNAFWGGIVAVAEAALMAEFTPIVRDAIIRMNTALDPEGAAATTPVQKRDHAMHEAAYWETRAKLAKKEGRGADVVAFYLRAVDANPRDFNPVGRSRLAGLAENAWITLGGTPEGWAAYRPEAAAPPTQWATVGRKMPEFSLQDTAGRPVRLADLAAKTVFINVWATWCGPCQGELPWVQRLFDTVKERRDVVVLTFNVDENPGLVAQYMQEHKFNFPVVLARSFVDDVMKVEAIPQNWIVDPSGVLRFERQAGFDDTFVKDTIEVMARAAGR